MLEFRPSYFNPTSSDFRELFGSGTNYQLTGTIPLCDGADLWARGINLWVAVDYFTQNARSSGLGSEIGIRMVPLTMGIKYFSPSTGGEIPVNFYGAAGMKYYFVHTYNNAPQVDHTINQRGMGGVVEAGVIASITESLVLDIFSSYSAKTFKPPSLSNPAVEAKGLDVSGFNIGAGIGYEF